MPPTGHSALDAFACSRFLVERDAYVRFVELVCAELGSEVGYLHLYDEGSQTLALNVWTTAAQVYCRTVYDGHYPLRQAGIWADSIRERRAVVHNDYAAAATHGLPEGHVRLRNHASFPVREGQRIVAVLGIGEVDGGFDDDRVARVEQLLRYGWPVLQNRLLDVRIRQLTAYDRYAHTSPYAVLKGMIAAIAGALELRDEYTAHHQQNVACVCERLALAVGLSEFERTGLEFGALLHDIGKLALPSSLLTRPGGVNGNELALLQTHSDVGADLLRHLDLPWPLVDMIAQHHERLDGSGYPRGLVRDQICEEARIIAIADTYDAMVCDRPYRRAPGFDAAITVISAGRGSLFDPPLVDAFLRLAREDPAFGGRYPL